MQAVQPKYGRGMTLAACLWLGLFPLLQGGSYTRITRDKWIAMLVLTALTFLCFLYDFFHGNTHSLFFRKGADGAGARLPCPLPVLLAGALLCWTVLSCLLSPAGPDVWWLGRQARMEGLATRLCYFALFFLFCASRVRLKPVLVSAAACAAVYCAVVLLQRAGGNPLGLYPPTYSYASSPEFQGTIGNIDMAAGWLCMLSGLFLVTLLSSFRKKDSRTSVLAAAAGLLPVLFLLFTIRVQFGFVTLAVLASAVFLRCLPKKARLPALILLLAAVLLLAWLWPGTSGGMWELHEILHGRSRPSFGSNRLAVWNCTLGLARERLFTGGGSATYPARFSRWLAENGRTIPKSQGSVPLPSVFDNAHNEYLAQLADHGLPAALLLAALFLSAVFRRREGWFPLLTPCSAAVLCYAVQAFFSFSVCLVAPMFWVLLGMSIPDSPKAL